MRIVDASYSETRFGSYPAFSREDVATRACSPEELATLNALLADGSVTVYQVSQESYTDKLRVVVPDARGLATFHDYLATLEASGRERQMLTCVGDICEEARFFGVADIGASRCSARRRYVETPGAGLRGVSFSDGEFASLWEMVEAYWHSTVEVECRWKVSYDEAQGAWQDMMR